jgi:hypothetical protein
MKIKRHFDNTPTNTKVDLEKYSGTNVSSPRTHTEALKFILFIVFILLFFVEKRGFTLMAQPGCLD